MAQSSFNRSGPRMIDNGISVIPIAPCEKWPGEMVGDQWRPMAGWQLFAFEKPSTFQMNIWWNYPDAGVGIVCGNIVGIDIDILEDPALAFEIEALARKMLGDTPLKRIGNFPKCMLVYRTDTPFKGMKYHPIEVLGLGQQFVAYGIHPVTGKPYFWPDETPDNVDISELPVITEEMARKWAIAAFKLVPEALRPKRLKASDTGSVHVSNEGQKGTVEAIADALPWIKNDDLPYDDWITIGMAAKGALGDAGEVLFEKWSDTSGKNDPGFTQRTWRSLAPHSLGAGTIYHFAMKAGWSLKSGHFFNPTQKKISETVDLTSFLSKVLKENN